ncbi:RICIN domain-containing protein [Streptomyces evansiae]|uniref:RICIN domain-containing protein n=1 Tax=Streptomyces evansiae TaxID=3075535 RepID=UPI0028853F2B|nr:ricin-type beta-trefoil lectin domain protein [Streptomyces sp. DSM 41859]MDT0421154.1 RICIN domain-containing protein [Streptomyces sp. DSM 41859]
MNRIARTATWASALSLAGLAATAGQAQAVTGFQIQNKATGLCLAGTVDSPGHAAQIYEAPCGSSNNQRWANTKSNFVMTAGGLVSLCMSADSYGGVFTAGCGASNTWGQDWKVDSLNGSYTNFYNENKGCYLQVIGGEAACMPGWTGDSKQFRVYWG